MIAVYEREREVYMLMLGSFLIFVQKQQLIFLVHVELQSNIREYITKTLQTGFTAWNALDAINSASDLLCLLGFTVYNVSLV